MAPVSTILLPIFALLNHANASPLFNLETLTSKPSLPSSQLPQPDPSTSLKYIVLGVGTQNYTCADSSSTTVPKSIGAVANLYDVTPYLSMPVLGDMLSKDLTCKADKYNGDIKYPKFGQHFFTAAGVPTFDLSAGTKSKDYPQGMKLSCKKVANSTAPADACKGRNGAAAVPWLTLDDNADGTTRGLKRVYRVNTTGGSAPATCSGANSSFTVDYAAEYWFYA